MYRKSLVILIKKIHYLTGFCTFLLPVPSSQGNFHKYDSVCGDLCNVSHAKTCYCFSKTVKQKLNFSQIFE